MLTTEENILLITKILLISAYILPFIYLIFIFSKKKNKKRKLKIGHFLVAIIIFLGILLIRWGVGKIEIKSDLDNNPVNGEVVTPPGDDNKDNPNYIDTTPKGYTLEKINGAYYVDGYLIVNKSYPLDSSWKPMNTYTEITEEICKSCIDKNAYNEWTKMKSDATAIGLNLYISSGFRSYDYQEGLYQSYVNRDGKEAADTYSARPGHSEHQSGLAFDLNTVDSSFAATNEGKWVHDNAHLYGFIIRYPKDKSNETGYKYESWHLRYVGLELADKLYNNGEWITMENYFGLNSKY